MLGNGAYKKDRAFPETGLLVLLARSGLHEKIYGRSVWPHRRFAGSRSASSRPSRETRPRECRNRGEERPGVRAGSSPPARRRWKSARADDPGRCGPSMSSTTLRLPRLVTTDPTYDRCGSPPGGSTLMTSAPWSPRTIVAVAPASPTVEVDNPGSF